MKYMKTKTTKTVLVDSSVWVANMNANDVWHEQAGKIMQTLAKKKMKLVITGMILSEVISNVRLRVGQTAAMDFYIRIRELEDNGVLETAMIGRKEEEEAMKILNKFPDLKKLSFVDACSAVLVKAKRAGSIASFDGDFEKIEVKGFGVINT